MFQDLGKELSIQSQINPEETKKIAKQILQKSEFIESTLHFDLGISRMRAKSVMDALKTACNNTLSPITNKEISK